MFACAPQLIFLSGISGPLTPTSHPTHKQQLIWGTAILSISPKAVQPETKQHSGEAGEASCGAEPPFCTYTVFTTTGEHSCHPNPATHDAAILFGRRLFGNVTGSQGKLSGLFSGCRCRAMRDFSGIILVLCGKGCIAPTRDDMSGALLVVVWPPWSGMAWLCTPGSKRTYSPSTLAVYF